MSMNAIEENRSEEEHCVSPRGITGGGNFCHNNTCMWHG